MQQKLSIYTLIRSAYAGFRTETIQTTMWFDKKRKSPLVSLNLHELLGDKFANYNSNNAVVAIVGMV